jgi:signal peptidase I
MFIILIIFIIQIYIVISSTSLKLSLIASNSMEPTLGKGDIVLWIPTKIEEIKAGDIVVFKSYIKWPNEKLIAHRVTNIKADKLTDNVVLETKGDANQWKDQDNQYINIPYIQEDDIQGKVVCFKSYPLKININLVIIFVVISIILSSFIQLYRLNNSKDAKFLFKTYP